MSKSMKVCGHCGKTEAECNKMVEMASGALVCDSCVAEMQAFFADEAAVEGHVHVLSVEQEPAQKGPRTPKEIVQYLDQYVIGQSDAKQTLAIAVYNHYKRLRNKTDVEIAKSNVMMLGPTGSGKTLLAQSMARFLDVPFAVADATSLTQAGYVGDDVETILQRLIQAADGDIARAQNGIVFIDEIDKVASAKSGPSITRDVSGEGVQQALLKIVEGAKVSVPVSGNRKTPGAQHNMIDTSKILFIVAGAFVPLLDKLKKPKNAKVLGFTPVLEKDSAEKEVTPDLLSTFGMIPEFVGRFPVIVTLAGLSAEDLERILTEPKNAMVRQQQALFEMDGATLTFEPGAVRAVAEKAHKLNIGARGARAILEKALKNALFEVPGTENASVVVHGDLSVTVAYPEQALKAA